MFKDGGAPSRLRKGASKATFKAYMIVQQIMNTNKAINDKQTIVSEDALATVTHKPQGLISSCSILLDYICNNYNTHPSNYGDSVENQYLRQSPMEPQGPRRKSQLKRILKKHTEKLYNTDNDNEIAPYENLEGHWTNKKNVSETTYEFTPYNTSCIPEEQEVFVEPQSGFFSTFSQANVSRILDTSDTIGQKIKQVDMEKLDDLLNNLNTSGILDPQFLEKVQAGLTTSEELAEYVRSWKTVSNKAMLDNTLDVVILLLVVYGGVKWATDNEDYKWLCLAGFAYLSYQHGTAMIDIARKLISLREDDLDDTEVVPQRGDFGIHDVGKVSSIILSGYTSCVSGKNIPSEIYRNLGSVDRVTSSIESTLTYIVEAVEITYNWIRLNFFEGGTYQRFIVHNDIRFQSIIDRSDEIDTMVRTSTFIPNAENTEKVTVLVYMISQLLRETPRTPDTANMCSELMSMRTKYTKLADNHCSAPQTTGNLRIEPVMIMFKGAPGVKKTVLAQQIANELIYTEASLVERKEIKANPNLFTFYRRPGEPFWETYTPNHKAVIIDDYGQSTDVAGGESSEFLDTIHMINSAPYPLRMAELADKGKRFFTSGYVVATTNLNDIRPVSVVCSEAVKRRVDFLVEIKPKPKYRIDGGTGFDHSKLPTIMVDGVLETSVELSMVTFDVVNWKGDTLHPDLQWYQLKEFIVESREKKKRYFSVLKKNILDTMEKIDRQTLAAGMEKEVLVEPQGPTRRFEYTSRYSGVQFDNEIYFHPDDDRDGLLLESYIMSKTSLFRSAMYSLFRKMGINVENSLSTICKMAIEKYGTLMFDICSEYGENRLLYEQVYSDIKTGNIQPLPIRKPEWFGEDKLKGIYETIKVSVYGLLTVGALKINDILERLKTFQMNKLIMVGIVLLLPSVIKLVKVYLLPFFKTMFGISDRSIDKCGETRNGQRHWPYGCNDEDCATTHYNGQRIEDPYKPESKGKDVHRSKIDRNIKNIKSRLLTPQMGSDPNGADMVTSIMKRNGYDMYMMQPDGSEDKYGYILAVASNIVLMPAHFITHTASLLTDKETTLETVLRFRRATKDRPVIFEMTVRDLIAGSESSELEQNDMILVQMPITFQMHKDITSYFVKESSVCKLHQYIDIGIILPHFERMIQVNVSAKFFDNKRINEADGSHYYVRQSYVYTGASTAKGDCGSTIVYLNPAIPKEKILGLHVAGSRDSNTGVCGVVTQESLIKALKKMTYTKFQDETFEAECDIPFSSGQFNYITKLSRTPRIPTSTKLTKSKLYGSYNDVFTPIEGPAPLECVMELEVIKNMYNNYYIERNRNTSYSEEVNDLLDFFYSTSHTDVERRLYTFEEAAGGIEGTSFKGVDRSTSNGYPYNMNPKTSRKSYFFGKDCAFDFKRPQAIKLKEEVEDYIDHCKRGIRIPQKYSDFPKDELRSLEKVQRKAIRIVSACTIVLLLTMRMYFGAFMRWINENHTFNGTTLCTNPQSLDWDLLVRNLQRFNIHINAGDFKHYDGSLTPALLWAVLDLINQWYNDGFNDIRRVIWYEIVYSWHIYAHFVFEWLGSMPSGNPMTAIINSICNHLMFRMAWKLLDIPVDFNEHVALTVNGDDNIFSTSPEYELVFNEFTVIRPLAEQGMIYTTENKEEIFEYCARTIDQIEYLKRGFVYNKDIKRWMGPLRLQKTLEMPYWTRSDDDQIVRDKVQDVIKELAYAGRETFERYAPRILSEYRKEYGNRYGWFNTTSYTQLLLTSC